MEEVAVGYEQCSCITLVGSINKHKNHGRHQKGKLPINEAYCYEQILYNAHLVNNKSSIFYPFNIS